MSRPGRQGRDRRPRPLAQPTPKSVCSAAHARLRRARNAFEQPASSAVLGLLVRAMVVEPFSTGPRLPGRRRADRRALHRPGADRRRAVRPRPVAEHLRQLLRRSGTDRGLHRLRRRGDGARRDRSGTGDEAGHAGGRVVRAVADADAPRRPRRLPQASRSVCVPACGATGPGPLRCRPRSTPSTPMQCRNPSGSGSAPSTRTYQSRSRSGSARLAVVLP
jgi:hypothetical protein